MRAFTFALFSLVLVLAASATPVKNEKDGLPVVHNYHPGHKCPAPEFYDDCNHCTCLKDGHSAACTLKACITTRKATADLPHNDFFEETRQCTPGQSFIDKCNPCRCNPDGTSAACTLALCPPVENPRIDNYLPGQKCPPGKSFHDKCNTCNCSPDGLTAACTLVECIGFEF